MRTRCYQVPLISAISGAFIILLGACRDPQIATYKAPKDLETMPSNLPAGHPDPAGMPPNSMPGGMSAADMASANTSDMPVGSDALTWVAPSHWKVKPASPMRKGSYAIPSPAGGAATDEADLSIFAFPGSTGGILDNVNRWRGQIGLGPIQQGELSANTTQFPAAQEGVQFTIVEIVSNDSATRMLGAILPGKGETYFFKMVGPTATVTAQKEAFFAMLKTVKVQ